MSKISATNSAVILVFGVAVFAGASLMFIIEPMIAKMLLPLFGGSPNVWNVCVVFFQLLLLTGYLYAHLLCTRVPIRLQTWIHLTLVWLAAFLLPTRLVTFGPVYDSPTLSLVQILVTLIGAPFFVLSTTAPVLSKWYAISGETNPYVLYAASNAGGLIGLLAYPFLLECNLKVVEQALFVQFTYAVYAALVTVSAVILARSRRKDLELNRVEAIEIIEEVPSTRTYVQWLILTMTPQSLVLGLTTYITSELSAIPFFWVVPLFVYLLSFVIAFSSIPPILRKFVSAGATFFTLLLLVLVTDGAYLGGFSALGAFLALHVVGLFFICCACHMRVASTRPSAYYLTSFYLTISAGGILGSCINTFLAPLLFKDYLEYPLMLIVAAILVIKETSMHTAAQNNKRILFEQSRLWLVPLVVLSITAASWWLAARIFDVLGDPENIGWKAAPEVCLAIALQFLLPLVLCKIISRSDHQLRGSIAAIGLFALLDYAAVPDFVVLQRRNFFGCLTIAARQDENICEFFHGRTLHGSESLDPDERGVPLSYYYPSGPIGRLLTSLFGPPETLRHLAAYNIPGAAELSNDPFELRKRRLANSSEPRPAPIAVIGLGAGTIAAYAKKGQSLVYYEIDPEVVDIATNPIYFTYIFQARARGVNIKIVKGDGRLEIQKAPYKHFQAIVVDAFTGDAIPTHLLTREAVQAYRSKLTNDGVIVFNVSNHYYDLKPLLQSLASEIKMVAFAIDDFAAPVNSRRVNASWVVLTSDEKVQADLKGAGWQRLNTGRKVRPWTDDFCSPLTVLSVPSLN